MAKTKILDTLASSTVLVSLSGTGGKSPSVKIPKEGKADLALKYGLAPELVKASLPALPPGYDEEWKALKKAFGLVRSEFYTASLPFGARQAAGKEDKQASGDRLLTTAKLTDGSFGTKFTLAGCQEGELYAQLGQVRQDFANNIASRVSQIAAAGVLGSLFQEAFYPDSADILAGWYYRAIQPQPMARTDVLEGMFLPADVARNIEQHMEAQAQEQLRFGQQQTILETVEHLQTMTKNLTKLNEWYSSQKGRRPSIYDSLVDNVQDSLSKLRDYAMPETEAGSRIVDLVDQLSEALDLTSISADDLKRDPQLASQKAKDAERAADQLSDALGSIWDNPPEHIQKATKSSKTASDDLTSLDDLLTGF